MDYSQLKIQLPLLGSSFVSPEVLEAVGAAPEGIVNTIVQIVIGVLSIIGFFRNRKNR